MIIISQRDVLKEVLDTINEYTDARPRVLIDLSSKLSLSNDMDVDSLCLIAICLDFEKKYSIRFTEPEMAVLKTVGDLANLIIVKRLNKHEHEQHPIQP